ncbi:MAG TPA: hypothetical protein VE503_01955 [Ornithinibacter sp.]|nr:hypothetical protein [Ornithinibacter sp.]
MATTDHPVHSAPRHARPLPGRLSRRVGYTLAIVLNVVLLVLVDDVPGWQALPFLTDDFAAVLWLVNATIVSGVLANAVYVIHDPPWVRALGDVVTTSIGLAALVQLWQVFPIAFAESTVDLDLIARWVLAVGIAGSVVGIVACAARLVRALTPPD